MGKLSGQPVTPLTKELHDKCIEQSESGKCVWVVDTSDNQFAGEFPWHVDSLKFYNYLIILELTHTLLPQFLVSCRVPTCKVIVVRKAFETDFYLKVTFAKISVTRLGDLLGLWAKF